jgi:hypothetical protein
MRIVHLNKDGFCLLFFFSNFPRKYACFTMLALDSPVCNAPETRCFLSVFGFDLVHVFIALQFPIDSRYRISYV